MGLSFLTPFFLAGFALLAVPVLIHLQRRHRARVLAFPSLMFLRKVEQASVRRRRIRHWALLALRCLALAILVLAFSRPILQAGATAVGELGEGRELVLLLDRSFSMGFEDRWDRARDAAREAINGMAEGDLASLVAFDEWSTILSRPIGDRLELEQLLASVELSPRPTRFAPVIKSARKIVLESELPDQEVLLISDFQRVGWDRGEDLRLPAGAEVRLVDLSDRDRLGATPSNLALISLILERSQLENRERIVVQARVSRRGGDQQLPASLSLSLNGRELESLEISVDPDSSTLVGFEDFSLPPGVSRGKVRIVGDSLAADNELFFVLSRGQTLPVLLLEEPRRGGGGSGLYIEKALSLAIEPMIQVRRLRGGRPSTDDLEQAAVVVLSDVELGSTSVAADLRSFVEEGGGLLVALGSRSGETHATLAEAGLLPKPSVGQGGGPAMRVTRLAFLDRTLPGFELFSGPRSGDFGTARFFRRQHLAPEADLDRVLARFEDGGAALLDRKVGDGRVMVWASTLDTYWNDFVLQPVFLPFLHQSVKNLSGFRPPAPWHTIGDVVDLADLRVDGEDQLSGQTLEITTPRGDEVVGGEVLEVEEAGFYSLTVDEEEVDVLAVNVDPRESDLASLDSEEFLAALQSLGGNSDAEGRAVVRTAEERERAQGLWRYLALVGLLLLVGEIFLANRLSMAS